MRTETVRLQARQVVIALTGDIQAKVRTELSFRVSGRVTERLVDVGMHVNAGDVLARIDPVEQQADLDGAKGRRRRGGIALDYAWLQPRSSDRRRCWRVVLPREHPLIRPKRACERPRARSKPPTLSLVRRKTP